MICIDATNMDYRQLCTEVQNCQDDISIIGRNTSGVKLMNIDQESNVTVARVAKVTSTDEEDPVNEEESEKKSDEVSGEE